MQFQNKEFPSKQWHAVSLFLLYVHYCYRHVTLCIKWLYLICKQCSCSITVLPSQCDRDLYKSANMCPALHTEQLPHQAGPLWLWPLLQKGVVWKYKIWNNISSPPVFICLFGRSIKCLELLTGFDCYSQECQTDVENGHRLMTQAI